MYIYYMVDEKTVNALQLLIVSYVLSQSPGYTIWKKTVLCCTYMVVNKV